MFYIYREVTRDALIVDPFTVPKSFQDAGLTSDVMANRIGDEVRDMEVATTTVMKDNLTSFQDEASIPEVEIPGTKLGLKTVIDITRSIFGVYPKHVSGDVVLDSTIENTPPSSKRNATVTIYVTQGRTRSEAAAVSSDSGNVTLLVQKSAETVLQQVNPYVLALYQYHHGQRRRAIALVDAIVRNKSQGRDQQAAAFVLWGNALMDEKKDDEAKHQTPIVLDPSSANAQINLGSMLRYEKDEEAIAKYQKATELDSKFAAAYNGWGNALMDEQKDDEAIAEYTKAIEVDPKFAAAYNNWGNALLHKQKDDEAVAKYQKAIELDPEFALAYNGWGNALLHNRKDDEAIAKYQKAIEINPTFEIAYDNWGLALQHEGKYDEAAAKYHKAEELSNSQSK